ncbi:ABC transporter ATP-binding protein [bacterium 210820-DFI.6.37]|nr:ABC transporter ATP-binding protein [bacterium 210820-DFI.6.37]
MIITAQNICKSYDEENILENISFSVGPGESLAILGESGRGKSTLISILGLLLQPDCGRVLLDGRDIIALKDIEKSKIRNKKFGFIFQHTQLIGSITVLDNVLVPAFLAGRQDLSQRAEALLEELGLSHRKYYYPYQLSIGQKRRVSLARALLMEPQIVFADEPTNDLDEENAGIVEEQLFKLLRQQRTLILVTHDETLANQARYRLRL